MQRKFYEDDDENEFSYFFLIWYLKHVLVLYYILFVSVCFGHREKIYQQ